MSLFNKNIDEPVEITLNSDPGDPKVVFSVKPCTQDMLDDAKTLAGPIPWGGNLIVDRVNTESLEVCETYAREQLPDEPEDTPYMTLINKLNGKQILTLSKLRSRRELEIMASLTTEEDAASQEAKRWVERNRVALLSLVVEKVDGEDLEDGQLLELLASIRPLELKSQVIDELHHITYALANLTPSGKASFVLQYGDTTTD